MLCTFLRIDDAADPGTPQAYRDRRGQDAGLVAAQIRAAGGRAIAVEADLSDPASPVRLFDAAEAELGQVDILVNNATGWVADTFAPAHADRLGRALPPVSAAAWRQQFTVELPVPDHAYRLWVITWRVVMTELGHEPAENDFPGTVAEGDCFVMESRCQGQSGIHHG